MGTFFFNVYLCILREREEREKDREGQRKRQREGIPSRLHAVSIEPDVGLYLTNHEIVT